MVKDIDKCWGFGTQPNLFQEYLSTGNMVSISLQEMINEMKLDSNRILCIFVRGGYRRMYSSVE